LKNIKHAVFDEIDNIDNIFLLRDSIALKFNGESVFKIGLHLVVRGHTTDYLMPSVDSHSTRSIRGILVDKEVISDCGHGV